MAAPDLPPILKPRDLKIVLVLAILVVSVLAIVGSLQPHSKPLISQKTLNELPCLWPGNCSQLNDDTSGAP